MLSQKTIYVNADKQWIVNEHGFKPRVNPSFYAGSNYSIIFYVDDDFGVPVNLTGYTFRCGIDYSFQSGHVDIALSDDDQFNRLGTTYSLVNGIINCRLACDSNTFKTYMDDNEQATGYVNLWAISPTNVKQLLTQFKCDLFNPVSNPSSLKVGGIGYMAVGSTLIVDTTY